MDDYTYPTELVRIIDGDTFVLKLDLGFGINFVQKFRLFGLDIYERRTPQGQEAIKFCEGWFRGSGPLKTATIKDRQGKYGRYLARIYDQFGECLNDVLRKNNFEKH